mmetsp:Transcript_16766/g.34160  ORF Transcript_16766/g.34160 Transcript_16766/m.34160 type:complete len:203 (+) Transcript_16766:9-617(+)
MGSMANGNFQLCSMGQKFSACLTFLLLFRFKKRIRVFSFAPPPVMDWTTSAICQSFVTSVVSECDIVPRTSLANVVRLQLLLSEIDQLLERKDTGPGDLNINTDEILELWKRSDLDHSALHEKDYEKEFLFVPGKVLQLHDDGSEVSSLYTDAHMSPIKTILFTTSMVSDHLSDSYRSILGKATPARTNGLLHRLGLKKSTA